jgi:hypothetical protein
MSSYAVHFYSNEKKRVTVEHFISNSISEAVKDCIEEIGVTEAEIVAVVLLES